MTARSYVSQTHDAQSLVADPARSPFGYYGAKQSIARRIIEILPPHNAWVEGFCGSAALTLSKPPVPIEVINDKDGQIVNLFTQLRDNAEGLCRAVELTPYARGEFERAREWVTGTGGGEDREVGGGQPELDPLEQARRFLVAAMMTVNGSIGMRAGWSYSQSYAREGREARVNRWCNLPDRLGRVVDRLRGIRIENRDARELVEMFVDRPATLMYLDPPYFTRREHGYMIDARDETFHQELLKKCVKARCMLLVSGYENELYAEILTATRGWERVDIDTTTRDTTGRDYPRTEVLWMNSVFTKARKGKRLPLRLTRREVREGKVNPPRSR